MSGFLTQRADCRWLKDVAEWIDEDGVACISCVFSWDLPKAVWRASTHLAAGRPVRVGGPAVTLQPGAFDGLDVEIGGEFEGGKTADGASVPLHYHNPNATFTSRGCIRRCPFCAVPRLEGELRELEDHEWTPKSQVCDNNLTACSRRHFDHVVDRLKAAGVRRVDFNQGLDARLFTKHHADRLGELDLYRVRFAWDHVREETHVRRAIALARAAGVPARGIGVYCLIGFDDTPEDALYRLREVHKLGCYVSPMRYQPLDVENRNGYVSPNWSDKLLRAYVAYWSSRRLSAIPFPEFLERRRCPISLST